MTCSGPFMGASGTQQFAHLQKGSHGLEAWRSGTVHCSVQPINPHFVVHLVVPFVQGSLVLLYSFSFPQPPSAQSV